MLVVIACSRLSDSGEEEKQLGRRGSEWYAKKGKGPEKEKRKGEPVLPLLRFSSRFIFMFALSQSPRTRLSRILEQTMVVLTTCFRKHGRILVKRIFLNYLVVFKNSCLISKENKFHNYVSETHMTPQKYKRSR